MAKIQPHHSRITITDTGYGLRIVIPYTRSWFVIFFLGFWICGWAVAEYMVGSQFLKGDAPPEGELFMVAWFGVWTIAGLVAIYAMLWQVMGKEVISVHGQVLTTRHDIGGFGFNREYDLVQMRDLRATPVGFNPLDLSSSLQLWGIGGGVIAFEHGAKTIRFGAGLDEAEAQEVVMVIKQHYRVQDSAAT